MYIHTVQRIQFCVNVQIVAIACILQQLIFVSDIRSLFGYTVFYFIELGRLSYNPVALNPSPLLPAIHSIHKINIYSYILGQK